MNSQPIKLREPMTLDEYLEFERKSPVRHEYVDGEIYAFAGATRRHSRVVSNLVYRLLDAARGGPCEVHSNEVKLQVTDSRIYYPDVMVVCDPEDTDELIVTRPCVVVDVLSPSSEKTDRQEKLIFYREIDSLQAYLIVSQDERRVIHHRRARDGDWRRDELIGSAGLHVPCLATELSLDQIYEGLDEPSAGANEA